MSWCAGLLLVMLMTSSTRGQMLKVNNLEAKVEDVDEGFIANAIEQLKEQLGVKDISEYIDLLRQRREDLKDNAFSAFDIAEHILESSDLESSDLREKALEQSLLKAHDLKSSDGKSPELKARGLKTSEVKSPNLELSDLKSHSSDLKARSLNVADLKGDALEHPGLKHPGDSDLKEPNPLARPNLESSWRTSPMERRHSPARRPRNKGIPAKAPKNIVLSKCPRRPDNLPVQIEGSVSPHPIQCGKNAPPMNLTATLTTEVTLDDPLVLDVKTYRETKPGNWVSIQCQNYWGTCRFEDVCGMLESLEGCSEELGVSCHCPIEKGTYTVRKENVTFKLARYAKGHYKSEVSLQMNGQELGCVVADYYVWCD